MGMGTEQVGHGRGRNQTRRHGATTTKHRSCRRQVPSRPYLFTPRGGRGPARPPRISFSPTHPHVRRQRACVVVLRVLALNEMSGGSVRAFFFFALALHGSDVAWRGGGAGWRVRRRCDGSARHVHENRSSPERRSRSSRVLVLAQCLGWACPRGHGYPDHGPSRAASRVGRRPWESSRRREAIQVLLAMMRLPYRARAMPHLVRATASSVLSFGPHAGNASAAVTLP
ncbi:hypothetical protein BJV78DRAFT_272744 [Lactifluus subvellereus]|nr:hypothetical protein BJV78DRAFT_272744 [Lactifluus subvellereus]